MVIILDGLAYGMLLFLMSAGLSVTLGLMNFVNLAHGVFAMVGAYTALGVMQGLGGNLYVALGAAFVVAAISGASLEVSLFRRMYRTHPLTQVLFTIGLVFVVVAIALFCFGPSLRSIQLPTTLQGQFDFAGISVGRYRLFLLVMGLVVALLLWGLLDYSRIGAMVRAAVDQPEVAAAMGLRVPRLFLWTFTLGAGLAGLGGALALDWLGMTPDFALKYMVYFLLVVCLGGAGTLLGPFMAALLIGIVDVAGKYYVPDLGCFLIYLLMVLGLIWRPHGLIRLHQT